MKKTSFAVAALLSSLSAVSVIPAAYAEGNTNSIEATANQGCTKCKCACAGQDDACQGCAACQGCSGCAGHCSGATDNPEDQTCSGYSGS